MMHPDSYKYTEFGCELGLFEYVVMPMGLTNSPATFQRWMSTIFKPEIERGIVSVYLDDMLTHSDAVKDHEKDV